MGGIFGKLSFDADEPLARAVLEQMLDAIGRRAMPAHALDSSRDIYAAPGVGMGAIVETSEAAPAAAVARTEDATVHVVADSRITNARELRARLTRDGHRFHDHSDAELIAHAYEQWGSRCVERLRGAFAFASWDARSRRLLIARDHLGVRPVYFAVLPGHGIVFATELQALFCDPGVARDWCATGIDAYLALGYVPAPLTAYRRISKLEPAQTLTIDGRRLHIEQYWDLPPAHTDGTMRDAVSGIEHRLRAAAREQLDDADPIATLYSGGIASSTLLGALPAERTTAVTIALEQTTAELSRSHEAAVLLGHAPEIAVATLDMPVLANELASYFDEPIGDPSAVAQFATCVAARAQADCVLTGHGAAALWAGQPRARAGKTGTFTLAGTFWNDALRRRLYTRGFAWQVREANPLSRHCELYAARESDDVIDRALYVDAHTILPDSTLAVAQRSAQAVGLRLRFPFLDREFVEFSATVPAALKQQGAAGMLALRAALSPRLPSSLLPAPHVPPAAPGWLHGTVAAMVPAVLLARRFDGRGIVSRPALTALWEEHASGRCDHARRLWSLLMLEFWFREFIDGDAVDEPLEYAVLKAA